MKALGKLVLELRALLFKYQCNVLYISRIKIEEYDYYLFSRGKKIGSLVKSLNRAFI